MQQGRHKRRARLPPDTGAGMRGLYDKPGQSGKGVPAQYRSRLGKTVKRPHLQRRDGRIGTAYRQTGDHDNRYRAQPHDLFKELEAIHPRHFDIKGNDVRLVLDDQIAGLDRISRLPTDGNTGVPFKDLLISALIVRESSTMRTFTGVSMAQ